MKKVILIWAVGCCLNIALVFYLIQNNFFEEKLIIPISWVIINLLPISLLIGYMSTLNRTQQVKKLVPLSSIYLFFCLLCIYSRNLISDFESFISFFKISPLLLFPFQLFVIFSTVKLIRNTNTSVDETFGEDDLDQSSQQKIKILFLGANPQSTSRVRIDEELREIEIGLRMSKERDNIILTSRHAVTIATLQQAILDEEPTIVHFSGHGLEEGIVLENNLGQTKVVSGFALEGLFKLFSNKIKCVVLNSCYSENQVKFIAKSIPCVIGMKSQIEDNAAITFSVGFYKALCAGKSIDFSYEFGINNLQLKGYSSSNIMRLENAKLQLSSNE